MGSPEAIRSSASSRGTGFLYDCGLDMNIWMTSALRSARLGQRVLGSYVSSDQHHVSSAWPT